MWLVSTLKFTKQNKKNSKNKRLKLVELSLEFKFIFSIFVRNNNKSSTPMSKMILMCQNFGLLSIHYTPSWLIKNS